MKIGWLKIALCILGILVNSSKGLTTQVVIKDCYKIEGQIVVNKPGIIFGGSGQIKRIVCL